MRIFYDGFIYDFQQYGGINRYFNEIIARLPKEFTPIVSTFLGPRRFWPEHPHRQIVRAKPFARLPALAGLGKAWMNFRTATTSAEIDHPTYYLLNAPRLIGRRRPLVVTVHDMIHEIFPQQIDRDGRLAAAKRVCIDKADAILCNSEYTRGDLLNRYPRAADKAFVTPLASSMNVDATAAQAIGGFERPFFLYVGGREGYKNFDTLLTAWTLFSAQHPDVLLRVVGSPWSPEEQRRLAEEKLESSIVHQGKADDEALAILYARSLALVYPSRYEGFGLPLLEAMRCGTAVICADTSSLPEVGGDAPYYFDPSQPEALVNQLEKVLESPGERTVRIQRGSVRARKFSWERTAALTVDVYRRFAKAGS